MSPPSRQLHIPQKCNFYLALKYRARKNQEIKLRLMMEHSLHPPLEPGQENAPVSWSPGRASNPLTSVHHFSKKGNTSGTFKGPRKRGCDSPYKSLLQRDLSLPLSQQSWKHQLLDLVPRRLQVPQILLGLENQAAPPRANMALSEPW